jgi:hypothetical protein
MSWFILAGYNFICKLCGRMNSQLAVMIEVSHVLKILCIFNIEDNMTQLLLSNSLFEAVIGISSKDKIFRAYPSLPLLLVAI